MRLGLLQQSCQLLSVAAATLAMARIERRPVLSYGYIGQRRLIRFVAGILWGFFCLSVLVGILWRAGLLVFDGMALSGSSALGFALAWGLLFLLVGFSEESFPYCVATFSTRLRGESASGGRHYYCRWYLPSDIRPTTVSQFKGSSKLGLPAFFSALAFGTPNRFGGRSASTPDGIGANPTFMERLTVAW